MTVRSVLSTLSVLLFAILVPSGRAHGECFINSDLECSYPYGAEENVKRAWVPKSVRARAALYNSPEVQNDESGCNVFARILRHECAPLEPVQAVFRDPVTKSDYNLLIISGGEEVWENRGKLPKVFQDYFTLDTIADAKLNNVAALSRLGPFNAQELINFLALTNGTAKLTVPTPCNVDASISICGVEATCIARKDPRVGDAITFVKAGALANSGSRVNSSWCSESETLDLVIGAMQRLYEASRNNSDQVIAVDAVPTPVAALPQFAAFKKMPLLNQVDGWIQGLAMDKYGDDDGKKVVTSGICLPTANAMLALALRGEAPGSRLRNRFDNLSPVSVMTVRKENSSPSSTTQLKYDHFAGHIDEMLRAGGLVTAGRGQPRKLIDFKNFFYRNRALVDPLEKVVHELTNFGFEEIAGYKIFFEADYAKAKPIQDTVKKNLKKWIANKTGVTVGLQSSASQPPQYSQQEIVAHANTVAGYSGSTLIVQDPWKVVSVLRFGSFKYKDAGDVLKRWYNTNFESCKSNWSRQCEASSQKFLDGLNDLINSNNRGTVVFNGTVLDPRRPPDKATLVKSCVALQVRENASNQRCPEYFEITRPGGDYEMLIHVGADADYVKGGGKASDTGYVGVRGLEGQKTAAYIKGFLIADPWPTYMSVDDYRALYSEDQTSAPNQAAGCTALTQGEVKVGDNSYFFKNPIPLVFGDLAKVESRSVVEVGCVDLHSKRPDGSIDPARVDLFGTMSITCTQNKIRVTKNSCSAIAAPVACSVPNGSGKIFPTITIKGVSFALSAPNTGPCTSITCNPGFTYNPVNQSCECLFKDAITGRALRGSISAAGGCRFDSASGCPIGTVQNASSDAFTPSCVKPEEPVSQTEWLDPRRRYLYRDSKGRPLAQFADPQSVYAFNRYGRIEWKGCKDPRYEARVNATGDQICVPSSSLSVATALVMKLSSGKKADGTCAEGFLFDFEKRYCVAALGTCYYGVGAHGMLTFDGTAPERCRFMGCVEGYSPLKFRLDGFDRYFCAPTDSYVVNNSQSGIEEVQNGTRTSPEIFDHIPVPPVTGADLSSETYTKNISTDLDCSRESDPRLRAACRSVASFSKMDLRNVNGVAITEEILRRWKVDTVMPLATFNCGGPDTLLLENGSCIANWSAKRAQFGECVIPNGRGKFEIGKGCVVESCLPGFVVNPSRRACLDTTRTCSRPDVPSTVGVTYLAQTYEGESQCLIGSCAAGNRFVDYFAPSDSFSGWFPTPLYSDFCAPLNATNGSSSLTQSNFASAVKSGSRSWYPGARCTAPGTYNTQGRYDLSGICRIVRCEPGQAPVHGSVTREITGCEQYRSETNVLSSYVFRSYLQPNSSFAFSVLPPGADSVTTPPACVSSGPRFPLKREILNALQFRMINADTFLANSPLDSTPSSLGITCSPPSVNKVVFELKNNSDQIIGVGSGNFDTVLPKLEQCLDQSMFLSGDGKSCIHAPSIGSFPLFLDGGYIVRDTPNPAMSGPVSELYDVVTNQVVGRFDYDVTDVSGFNPNRERANLSYNQSLGTSPIPPRAPFLICPVGTRASGASCVSDTESCGPFGNGVYARRWQGNGYGQCSVQCNLGFKFESGQCVRVQ